MIPTKLFNCSRKGLYRRLNFKPQLWSWSLLFIDMDELVVPFCMLDDNKHLPNPRSIIQIAISDYRNSAISDKELSEHICNSLALLMKDYNLNIECYKDTFHLVFRENQN